MRCLLRLALLAGCLAAGVSAAGAAAATEATKPAALGSAVCSFRQQQPRFWGSRTPLTVFNVASIGTSDIFLNDALLRSLTQQLGLAQCQVLLTQGERCSTALAAVPCADPLWLCDGTVTISNSVYEAAKSGLCTGSGDKPTSAVCQTLDDYPAIAQYVAADRCEPVCFAQLTRRTNSTRQTMAPPPPAGASVGGCFTFSLQVDAATEQSIRDTTASMRSTETTTALAADLRSFSAANSRIKLIFGDADVTQVVGFGYFPPPSPPPNPPPPRPPSPPPPSPSPPPSPPPPSPPPPSPPPPLLPFNPGNSTSNDTVSAESIDDTATLQYSAWSRCSAACGDGWQTRTASCVTLNGTLLAMNQCPEAADAVTSRPCRGPPCEKPHWEYTPWTMCSAPCGGGVSTRRATCVAGGLGAACDPSELLAVEQACNTGPCKVYTWHAMDWNACTAECGGGTQTRSVACVDSLGQEAGDSMCTGIKPVAEQRCNLQACDFCDSTNCFQNGFCQDGVCTCGPGVNFTGTYCEVPMPCASGVVDAQLQCCPSGVVDSRGACCTPGAVLDASGSCCASGLLDACGMCGGNGKFLDITGTCCYTLSDASGVCCQSGLVDDCGVCNGMGNSCGVDLTLTIRVDGDLVHGDSIEEAPLEAFLLNVTEALQLPDGILTLDSLHETSPPTDELSTASMTGTRRRFLLAAAAPTAAPATIPAASKKAPESEPLYLTATISLKPSDAANSSLGLSATALQAALWEVMTTQPAEDPVVLTAIDSVSRVGVCGNSICEVGERTVEGLITGNCPQDCPFETKKCPDTCGSGACQPASGTCECFAAYAGPTCQDCAAGFTQVNGACTANVVPLGLAPEPGLPPSEDAGINAGTPDASKSSSSVNVGAIVGPVVAVVAILVAIAGYLVYRRRRNAFMGFAITNTSYISNSDGYVSSTGARPDIESQFLPNVEDDRRSLREKYSSVDGHSSQGGGNTARSLGGFSSHDAPTARSVRTSQEQFKIMAAGVTRGDSLRQSAGSLQNAGVRSNGTIPSARIAAAAVTATIASRTPVVIDSFMNKGDSSHDEQGVVSSSSGNTASQAAPQQFMSPPPTEPSMLGTETSTQMEAASMAVHPVMSAHPSMSQMSPSATDVGVQGGVDASLVHYTDPIDENAMSPADDQSRLFFNNVYNADDICRMSESSTVISKSHVPGRVVRAHSAHPSLGGSEPTDNGTELPEEPSRAARSPLEGLDAKAKREKLESLRQAVEALEADAAARRVSARSSARSKTIAAPGELESPPNTQPANVDVHASYESVCWVAQDQQVNASLEVPAEPEAERKFLGGRPDVPKLSLGKLRPTEQGAPAVDPMGGHPAAMLAAPAKAPAVMPAAVAITAAAAVGVPDPTDEQVTIAAVPDPGHLAGYSKPASFNKPPQLVLSSLDNLASQSSGEDMADPLSLVENPDAVLDRARQQHSARGGIAQGFGKLLSPLLSGRRQQQDADFSSQMSSRVSPKSWAEDQGMQRTQSGRDLQRSRDEPLTSPGGSTQDISPSTTQGSTFSGSSSRFFNTPRSQLLRSLAAEAAAAQKERSQRAAAQAAQPPPTYSAVMSAVDAALKSATASPSKLPRLEANISTTMADGSSSTGGGSGGGSKIPAAGGGAGSRIPSPVKPGGSKMPSGSSSRIPSPAKSGSSQSQSPSPSKIARPPPQQSFRRRE